MAASRPLATPPCLETRPPSRALPAVRQTGLPLSIVSIASTCAAFSDTEVFPPPPVPRGAPPPEGAAALTFHIQFESSGKWPSDLAAVANLKTVSRNPHMPMLPSAELTV